MPNDVLEEDPHRSRTARELRWVHPFQPVGPVDRRGLRSETGRFSHAERVVGLHPPAQLATTLGLFGGTGPQHNTALPVVTASVAPAFDADDELSLPDGTTGRVRLAEGPDRPEVADRRP